MFIFRVAMIFTTYQNNCSAFDFIIYIINDLRKKNTSALVQFLAFLGLINNHIVYSSVFFFPPPVRSTLTTGLYISEKKT